MPRHGKTGGGKRRTVKTGLQRAAVIVAAAGGSAEDDGNALRTVAGKRRMDGIFNLCQRLPEQGVVMAAVVRWQRGRG